MRKSFAVWSLVAASIFLGSCAEDTRPRGQGIAKPISPGTSYPDVEDRPSAEPRDVMSR